MIEHKKKFLFVSKWGEILDIANTVQKEGNLVKLFIETVSCREVGLGFVPKTRDWKKQVDWADVIIFDYIGWGKEAEELRHAGKHVIGGCEYSDKLELDRSFGQEELKKNKIKILNYKEFTSYQEAIEYVQNNPHSYVLKPSGKMQDYKQLLFVGKEDDGNDIIRVLKAYEKTWGSDLEVFQLQRKVNGVEVSVAAFFNGTQFIKPYNITFEHKKLFPKELGVSTGEMGTSMFWTEESPLFNATLLKLENELKKHHFVGHIDVNCIVNGNGIYPLEFTTRFGYPQIFIQQAGITEPIGMMLYKIATGLEFKIQVKKGFQIGAYMVVPPFPFQDKKSFEMFSKDAIVILRKPMKEGIHIQDLKNINGEWLITGDTGVALLISGTGTTMKEAQKVMYNRINNVLINSSYYRTDIGDRWSEDSDKLWAWGYL
ncbi:phosphoribosylamine--glycine ligase [Lentimicrobium sp. L6]|uniref:phosphoribosylamine--glycine ligase n=2 Tax=unclassified Lentimicrobium TaxID=2677434 RepID=UPI001554ED61|nr:phosphoribosylamine--glycine ligase [Lentimicrobium sp. L6]NPD84722.1 phosphoribosylamine--glycine ligase [Lentimicrobium sp. L6]